MDECVCTGASAFFDLISIKWLRFSYVNHTLHDVFACGTEAIELPHFREHAITTSHRFPYIHITGVCSELWVTQISEGMYIDRSAASMRSYVFNWMCLSYALAVHTLGESLFATFSSGDSVCVHTIDKLMVFRAAKLGDGFTWGCEPLT